MMGTFVDVVLQAGRSAIELALYTLMPIMVVTMVVLRLLEVHGILDRLVAWCAPVARPFGLTGLAVLAMLQISFVSFVAPLPTLTLMEDQGTSDRHLAAALAAVLAMAPANATFPLAARGLLPGVTLAFSALGGLVAAAATYWLSGRHLSGALVAASFYERVAATKPSFLRTINLGGAEAIQIVVNIVPTLLLSLAVVFGLERAGVVGELTRLLAPVLAALGVDPGFVLPTLTKYLAGSTALLGVVDGLAREGRFGAAMVNEGAGFLLHPLDLPGVAILISAGPRLGRTLLPAVGGAVLGIALRTVGGVAFAAWMR
ncbi:nucleoside recognition domain-containing protein [Lichenibacterium dinghuense]|uniref:nucleoside recognition domain-containing protein n=1 Tax=Lichenibacterium dinghuense TaxID=2895977 RepID=UPI001F1B0A4F|nr:nucleoside recognition domain-containing protein [Lichenibacterium sp. 6Y81]